MEPLLVFFASSCEMWNLIGSILTVYQLQISVPTSFNSTLTLQNTMQHMVGGSLLLYDGTSLRA